MTLNVVEFSQGWLAILSTKCGFLSRRCHCHNVATIMRHVSSPKAVPSIFTPSTGPGSLLMFPWRCPTPFWWFLEHCFHLGFKATSQQLDFGIVVSMQPFFLLFSMVFETVFFTSTLQQHLNNLILASGFLCCRFCFRFLMIFEAVLFTWVLQQHLKHLIFA